MWPCTTSQRPNVRRQSRSDRRYEATATLTAVVEQLQEIADDPLLTDDVKNAATDFIDDVQQVLDEAEGVEFPGRNV